MSGSGVTQDGLCGSNAGTLGPSFVERPYQQRHGGWRRQHIPAPNFTSLALPHRK